MKINTILKNLKKSEILYNNQLEDYIKQLSISINTEIIKTKEELLKAICDDEDLDFDNLYTKYIKPLKKDKRKTNHKVDLILDSDDSDDEESEIKKNLAKQEKNNQEKLPLEKHTIKNKLCYIENIEGGNIFDSNVKKIGEVKNGSFLLYDN